MSAPKLATLYRMVMPGHTCPYGLKSLDLLNRKGSSLQGKLTTRYGTPYPALH